MRRDDELAMVHGSGRRRLAALAALALALGLGAALACGGRTEDEQLQRQAKQAVEAGDYEAAIALLDRAIALAPEEGTYHRRRGSVLEELDRQDEALAAYDLAIAADRPSQSAHLKAIALCLELDRLAEMEKRLAAARAVLDDREELGNLAALEAQLRQRGGAPAAVGAGPPGGGAETD